MFALSMGVFHHNPLYRTVVDGRHADPLALQLLDAITSGNSLPCPTNFTTRSDCRIARHYKWSIEAAFHRFNSPGVNAESAENWDHVESRDGCFRGKRKLTRCRCCMVLLGCFEFLQRCFTSI